MHKVIKILFYFSFDCLSNLRYSNSSIIIEYEDFVKFSSFIICDFWFDTLHEWIKKLDHKS